MTRQATHKQQSIPQHRLGLWLTLLVVIGLLFACTPATAPAPAAEEAAAPQSEAAAPAAAVDTAQKEAPLLAEQVTAGTLPALEERLPVTPKVVTPVSGPGQYGGTWHMGLNGGQDNALLTRTMGYEHLVRWTPDWTAIEPNIAESYEVNDEATEYTFKLH